MVETMKDQFIITLGHIQYVIYNIVLSYIASATSIK